MTVQEIAKAVARPEKTVRTWTKKASAKMATITAKMAASSPMKPADYDIGVYGYGVRCEENPR